MRTSSLLGTTLAALLVAAPGLALAQASGNAGNNAGANNFVGQHNDQYHANGSRDGGNGGGMAYANFGWGGYNGMGTPVRNNNGDNGNNGWGRWGNNNNGNNAANMRPSQRNPLLADNGDVRASQMIGTTVYNANNQNLGSINDVLIGRNGIWAVVSTNNKKVAVPFRDFEFGNANRDGNDKLVLPNISEARLNAQPALHYNANNYNNGNNSGGAGGWFSRNGNGGNSGYNNAGNTGGGWFGHNNNGSNGNNG